MKTERIALTLIALLASVAGAQPRVVATQPDLAHLARALGGPKIAVQSLTHGGDDLHLVKVRPSHLIAARRADIFLQLGFDAEHAWVPALLRTSRNRKIQPGGRGFVNCSAGIEALGATEERTRSRGVDLHRQGNPHYNLDPGSMRVVAGTIAGALKRAWPEEADAIDERLAAWQSKLDDKLKAWQQRLKPFAGRPFIEHHEAWVYFAERFDLEIVAQLEPGPGLPPTASHLKSVIETGRTHQAQLVVSRPATLDVAKRVAAEIGANAVALPLASSRDAKGGWIAWMDEVVETFAEHLGRPQ